MGGALLLKTVRPEPVEDWIAEIRRINPDLDVRVWPDFGNGSEIEFALICKTPQSEQWPGRDLFVLPNLRFIATVNAGVEYLLDDPELPRDLAIVRAGSPSGDQMMTETVLMHVFRHHRRMHDYAQQQAARQWKRLSETHPSRHVVGFMGFGAIAKPAAPLLRALGFRVACWTRMPKDEADVMCFAGMAGLPEFLAATDIVVMLLPLSAQTKGLINTQTLRMLKPGSHIVNLARGAHIDEEALLEALDAGHLAAATMDVFRTEPLPPESRFWQHPKVTVMPHTARRILPESIVPQLLENIRRSRMGKELAFVVDRAAGY